MNCLVSFFCGSYLRAREQIRRNAGITLVYDSDDEV